MGLLFVVGSVSSITELNRRVFHWQNFWVSLIQFDYRTQSKSIKRLEFNWVRLPNVRLTMPGRTHYGGPQLLHQIQVGHMKNKILTSNTKWLTSKTNCSHQKQNPYIKYKLRTSNIKVIPWFCTAHLLLHITRWPL